MKLLNIVTISLYLILGTLVLIDSPNLIDTSTYLFNELPDISKHEKEMLMPNKLIFEIVMSTLKLTILSVLIISLISNRLRKNRIILYTASFMFFIFMIFDLPIHKCSNGNLESYWESGRHFH